MDGLSGSTRMIRQQQINCAAVAQALGVERSLFHGWSLAFTLLEGGDRGGGKETTHHQQQQPHQDQQDDQQLPRPPAVASAGKAPAKWAARVMTEMAGTPRTPCTTDTGSTGEYGGDDRHSTQVTAASSGNAPHHQKKATTTRSLQHEIAFSLTGSAFNIDDAREHAAQSLLHQLMDTHNMAPLPPPQNGGDGQQPLSAGGRRSTFSDAHREEQRRQREARYERNTKAAPLGGNTVIFLRCAPPPASHDNDDDAHHSHHGDTHHDIRHTNTGTSNASSMDGPDHEVLFLLHPLAASYSTLVRDLYDMLESAGEVGGGGAGGIDDNDALSTTVTVRQQHQRKRPPGSGSNNNRREGGGGYTTTTTAAAEEESSLLLLREAFAAIDAKKNADRGGGGGGGDFNHDAPSLLEGLGDDVREGWRPEHTLRLRPVDLRHIRGGSLVDFAAHRHGSHIAITTPSNTTTTAQTRAPNSGAAGTADVCAAASTHLAEAAVARAMPHMACGNARWNHYHVACDDHHHVDPDHHHHHHHHHHASSGSTDDTFFYGAHAYDVERSADAATEATAWFGSLSTVGSQPCARATVHYAQGCTQWINQTYLDTAPHDCGDDTKWANANVGSEYAFSALPEPKHTAAFLAGQDMAALLQTAETFQEGLTLAIARRLLSVACSGGGEGRDEDDNDNDDENEDHCPSFEQSVHCIQTARPIVLDVPGATPDALAHIAAYAHMLAARAHALGVFLRPPPTQADPDQRLADDVLDDEGPAPGVDDAEGAGGAGAGAATTGLPLPVRAHRNRLDSESDDPEPPIARPPLPSSSGAGALAPLPRNALSNLDLYAYLCDVYELHNVSNSPRSTSSRLRPHGQMLQAHTAGSDVPGSQRGAAARRQMMTADPASFNIRKFFRPFTVHPQPCSEADAAHLWPLLLTDALPHPLRLLTDRTVVTERATATGAPIQSENILGTCLAASVPACKGLVYPMMPLLPYEIVFAHQLLLPMDPFPRAAAPRARPAQPTMAAASTTVGTTANSAATANVLRPPSSTTSTSTIMASDDDEDSDNDIAFNTNYDVDAAYQSVPSPIVLSTASQPTVTVVPLPNAAPPTPATTTSDGGSTDSTTTSTVVSPHDTEHPNGITLVCPSSPLPPPPPPLPPKQLPISSSSQQQRQQPQPVTPVSPPPLPPAESRAFCLVPPPPQTYNSVAPDGPLVAVSNDVSSDTALLFGTVAPLEGRLLCDATTVGAFLLGPCAFTLTDDNRVCAFDDPYTSALAAAASQAQRKLSARAAVRIGDVSPATAATYGVFPASTAALQPSRHRCVLCASVLLSPLIRIRRDESDGNSGRGRERVLLPLAAYAPLLAHAQRVIQESQQCIGGGVEVTAATKPLPLMLGGGGGVGACHQQRMGEPPRHLWQHLSSLLCRHAAASSANNGDERAASPTIDSRIHTKSVDDAAIASHCHAALQRLPQTHVGLMGGHKAFRNAAAVQRVMAECLPVATAQALSLCRCAVAMPSDATVTTAAMRDNDREPVSHMLPPSYSEPDYVAPVSTNRAQRAKNTPIEEMMIIVPDDADANTSKTSAALEELHDEVVLAAWSAERARTAARDHLLLTLAVARTAAVMKAADFLQLTPLVELCGRAMAAMLQNRRPAEMHQLLAEAAAL